MADSSPKTLSPLSLSLFLSLSLPLPPQPMFTRCFFSNDVSSASPSAGSLTKPFFDSLACHDAIASGASCQVCETKFKHCRGREAVRGARRSGYGLDRGGWTVAMTRPERCVGPGFNPGATSKGDEIGCGPLQHDRSEVFFGDVGS